MLWIKILCITGFFATYCVPYPHAMTFLGNKMPNSLLESSKAHIVEGSVAF